MTLQGGGSCSKTSGTQGVGGGQGKIALSQKLLGRKPLPLSLLPVRLPTHIHINAGSWRWRHISLPTPPHTLLGCRHQALSRGQQSSCPLSLPAHPILNPQSQKTLSLAFPRTSPQPWVCPAAVASAGESRPLHRAEGC